MRTEKEKFGIKSMLFILWFVISIVAILVLRKYSELFSIMVIGQVFLVFGLAIKKDGVKINEVKLILMYVGLLLVGVPFLMYISKFYNVYDKFNWSYIIAILGVGSFMLLGLGLMFIPKINKKRLTEICTEKVKAIVIRHDSHWSGDDPADVYCPVYGFEFNKEKYEVRNNLYWYFAEPEVGTEVEIKINPSNPYDFLLEDDTDRKLFSVGLLFFIPSFIGLVVLIIKILF